MRSLRRSTILVLAGVALLVVSIGAGAVLAPNIGTGGGDGQLTLVGSQGGGQGYHKFGSIYLLNGSQKVWEEDSAKSYFEVEQLDNGTVVTGFMDSGYEDCAPYNFDTCTHTGYRLVDPDASGGPEVVSEFGFPVRTDTNSEIHAATPLPDGGYVITDMDRERVLIREGGEITWQWNASALYDEPPDVTDVDWLHINDVDVISEGRFLVSVRNANQLLVIERGEGVVEIINKDTDDSNDDACQTDANFALYEQLKDHDGDGDIRCGDPNVLDHQHNPQWLGDGAVLVADSHNNRVVELHRNDDGQWEPVWSLGGAGGVGFNWPRDADRLPNGNTLITDSRNKRIVEVNENGTVAWSVQTDHIPYEADRLPYGESNQVPKSEANSSIDFEERSVPVLSTLSVAAHSAFPWLPFWFGEWQILSVLVTIGLVTSGTTMRTYYWWQGRSESETEHEETTRESESEDE